MRIQQLLNNSLKLDIKINQNNIVGEVTFWKFSANTSVIPKESGDNFYLSSLNYVLN